MPATAPAGNLSGFVPADAAELAERKVSRYQSARDNRGRPIALVEILEAIQAGHWEKPVAAIREALAAGDTAKAESLKTALEGFTVSGVFAPTRAKINLKEPTGCIILDVDHLASTAEAEATRDTLGTDPHVLAAFVSPSGLGVKAVVYVGTCPDDAEAKAAWPSLAEYLATTYSIQTDPSGKDVCRLCFVSHDPGAIIRTGEVRPFTARAEAMKPASPAAHKATWPNKSQQEIAEQVGCAVSYVNGIKKDKFSSEIIPPTRTDSMGRTRPTSYATRKPATPDASVIRSAVAVLDAGCSRADWLAVACSIKNALGDSGFQIFDSWSATAPAKYDAAEARKLWDTIDADGGVTVGTLFHRAEEAGWINPTGRLALSIRRQQAAEQAEGEGEVEVEAEPPAAPKPWEGITERQIAEAIDGSLLEPMVRALSSVTKPPLPIGIALPKALGLAGCALSQPIEYDRKTEERRGIELARNVIETAGGQTLNVMACIVYPSGECKDIGNIPATLTHSEGVNIGNAGSAEGLADAYIDNGAGMLIISELQPYLDANKWQHTATGLLNAGWNQHQIKVVLSRRNGDPRDVRYCAPNVIANVQPKVLAELADPLLLDSGFLNRFLFTYSDAPTSRRPNTDPISLEPLRRAFKAYRRMQVRVRVPQDYLQNVLDEFIAHDAPLPGHYNRLVNEYGPRLAFMLAVNPNRPNTLEITPAHWERAAVLVRWFFGHACRALEGIGEDRYVRRMEARLSRMLAWIQKHPKGVQKKFFTLAFHKGSAAADRDRDLNELEERGQIFIQKTGGRTILKPTKEAAL